MRLNETVPIPLPNELVTVLEPAVLDLVKALGLTPDVEDEVFHVLASLPPAERIKEALTLYEPIPLSFNDEW